ncbi:hypothetical protein PANT_11d00011 [Moesziomyces antarcticus T-34]|uniref:SWR1-complex protein 5 n=1 Tax=Pseudozyma antarctica (strain T-34) TaxID=1151754 RepID=M9LW31_PSEA3|nr:hypothetical protein PANT_11d00011 [Moesziomyces antarcticus T-34]
MSAATAASTSARPLAVRKDDSDAASDSEDDDFAPEPSGARSPKASRQSRRARGSDDSSSGEDSEGEEDPVTAEAVDEEELEALKCERQELVAAAGGEDRLGKRRRLAKHDTAAAEASASKDETDALKAKADAEWEAMKASETKDPAAASDSSTQGALAATAGEEMVAVPTTFTFAGEVQASTRLLPRTHPDAIAYLSQSTSKAPAAPVATPAARPAPGPRRKKTSSLATLSAAATAKPTKLNTLEKSKLDWDSFKHDRTAMSQQERDQLDAQTTGGSRGLGDMKGYLDRRDFLDRVHERTSKP